MYLFFDGVRDVGSHRHRFSLFRTVLDGFPHIGEGLSFCHSRILRRQLKRRYVLSFFQKAACQVGIHDNDG